jgi:hypothetical protein
MDGNVTIGEGRDDQGNVLENGALYRIYRANEASSKGLLAYYAGDGDWIDASTDDWATIVSEESGPPVYAHRQNAPIRPDLQLFA